MAVMLYFFQNLIHSDLQCFFYLCETVQEVIPLTCINCAPLFETKIK